MSEEAQTDNLSREAAHALVAGLIDDDQTNAELVELQLCALVPAGVAAIFEAESRKRLFGLVLGSDAVCTIELQSIRQTASNSAYPDSVADRTVRIAITHTRLAADECSARLVAEVIRQSEVKEFQFIKETATRERTWALNVPGVDQPLRFTTEEELASRRWRADGGARARSEAEWEPTSKPVVDQERLARAFAKVSGWATPTEDLGREELAARLQG